jgi:hypothetical protein
VEFEEAIKLLPASDVAVLKDRVVEYNHRIWGKKIADELDSGKLDKLLAEVEAEYQAGLSTPL